MGASLDPVTPQYLRSEIERLEGELLQARRQIRTLTTTVADQAKTLAAVTDDVPPGAPSVACIYWLYGPTRWHEPSWPKIANRLQPLIRDIGDLPAQLLAPIAWGHHMARRKTERNRFGNLPKDLTLNFELWRAKEMLSWAVANRMLKYNPLTPARRISTVTRRETWIKSDDVDRLVDVTDDLVDLRLNEGDDDGLKAKLLRGFVLCCHDSLLRFNEARTLRWDRIGDDGGVDLQAIQTKSRRRRKVFLTPRTREALDLIPRESISPYVFTYREGKLISEGGLRRWFRRAAKMSGADALVAPGEGNLRVHDLRASGATTADEAGARPTAIRDAMGHSSLSATQIYLRSSKTDNARSIAEVMTDAVRRPPKKSSRR